ncbi:fungal-specific transcription factor domain-containing protein [Talaromyces proteolyticus]|uniref:Fungal-specific transcription factor domain-containing protein n=1 Tax=Talaromyces proteolyticus TaxID=1131652 RepID=A0AAD4KJ25_9EURO|nr:fungal-specific transcription factor domain-containing protein [Talaromyces proteolyticus]KAH8693675.1 fungal-specific transcription factor domain-containing protein [Talaromyces proteolyticus]
MRGVKKSRNGCATCKSKRLKCDEGKPSCGRCARLGMECPGYSQSLRWITKHEVLDNGRRSSPKHSEASPRLAQDVLQNPNNSEMTLSSTDDPATLLDDINSPLDFEQWDRQFNPVLPGPGQIDTTRSLSDTGYDPAVEGSPADTATPRSVAFSNLLPENATSIEEDYFPSPLLLRQSPIPRCSNNRLSILPPLRKSLEDPSSTLVEYYFKEVAGLFSSYDSHMNPFRTTVSRLWTSSSVLCRTLQSMAAATLVDDFPQFGPVGLKMRDEAISFLEKQPALDDKSLLAVLMLGQTASWHKANDLGVSFFNLLRNHLNSISASGSGATSLTNRNNYQFFEEALVYWEMLLSYVADHGTLISSTNPDLHPAADNSLTQRVPHPWTGIARDTQFAVHEVGRLVRGERNRMRSKRFTSRSDIAQAQRAIEKAQELEQTLLNLSHPTETEVVNPGDDDTPVWHLLAMAEVYRYTGLLQLYRAFPDLLWSRIQSGDIAGEPLMPRSNISFLDQSNGHSSGFLSYADLPEEIFGDFQFDDGSDISPAVHDEWLTRFAVTAMSKLKTIPHESRTRCLQPFLLVASSSELRLPPTTLPLFDESEDDHTLNLSTHAIEVSRTRKFILGRLSSFLHVLPPKPIHVCLQLVNEIWSRMDAGESDVFWMDVMIEKGWETTMG